MDEHRPDWQALPVIGGRPGGSLGAARRAAAFDGVRAFARERYEAASAEIEDHLDDVIDAGNQVITVVTSRGRGRASGAEVDRTHAEVWTFREGRIVLVEWVESRAEGDIAGER